MSNMVTGMDGRLYEVGKVYYVGCALVLMRRGDPRVLCADVASDELDSYLDDFSVRIYTNAKRKKRKQSQTGWPAA